MTHYIYQNDVPVQVNALLSKPSDAVPYTSQVHGDHTYGERAGRGMWEVGGRRTVHKCIRCVGGLT